LKDIDEFLLNQYKDNKAGKKRDWRKYEQQLANRIKGATAVGMTDYPRPCFIP
jgi:hypothetical protein